MTIVKELNKLAEKITGTNPKATTDKKALDYIADYYAQENLKPTTNAQAIKNITDNFTSGGGKTNKEVFASSYYSAGATIYSISVNSKISQDNLSSLLGSLPYMQEIPAIVVQLVDNFDFANAGIYIMKYNTEQSQYVAYNVDTSNVRYFTYNDGSQMFSEVE